LVRRGAPEMGAGGSPAVVPLILRAVAMLFVFATIFDSFTFSFFEKSDNLAQIVGFVMAWLFVILRLRKLKIEGKDFKWFLVFFVITALEEVVRSFTLGPVGAARSVRNYFSFFQAFLLYIIMRDVSADSRVFRGVMAVFYLTYLCGSVLTDLGWQVVTKEVAGGRTGLVGQNLNAFAFSLAVITVVIISWALAHWPRLGFGGWLAVGSLFVLVPAIAETGSRGGLVALVFGLLVGGVVTARGKRVPFHVVFVPVVLGVVLHVMMGTEVMHRRIDATLYEHDYGTRDVLAEGSMVLFKRHPILGVGPAYVGALGRVLGLKGGLAAHNTYLQMLLSFGIVGTVPFLIAFGMSVLRLWRLRGPPWVGIWFAVLAMTAAYGVTSHLGYNKHFWIILALAANSPLMGRRVPARVPVRHRSMAGGPFAGARPPLPQMGRLHGRVPGGRA